MGSEYRILSSVVLLFLLSGCGIKTVPVYDATYSLATPNNKFDCKCRYNETKKHSGDNAYCRTTLKAIAKKSYPYAIMSSNAYPGGTQIDIADWDKVERFESAKGFGADVYLSTNRESAVIAFRGTDNIADWIFANFYINLFSGGQFSQADEVYNHVVYKYHPEKITTTGHSLGGGLAMRISFRNKGVDAFVFNSSSRTATGVSTKNIWQNKIISIRDSGEALAPLRRLPLFDRTEEYRYNFSGGNPINEHNMERFARCLFTAAELSDSEYISNSKDNKGCVAANTQGCADTSVDENTPRH